MLQFDTYIGALCAIQDFLLVLIKDFATNEMLFVEILDILEAAMDMAFKKAGLKGIQAQFENLYLIQKELSRGLCLGTKCRNASGSWESQKESQNRDMNQNNELRIGGDKFVIAFQDEIKLKNNLK
jgi:hypothetical protein